MEKKMEPLKIRTTTDGAVDLLQSINGDDDEASVIRIPVHQIDLVIEWLMEAKTELTSQPQPAPVRSVKQQA